MPKQDDIALARYKIEKANSCLKASNLLLSEDFYADSANRSYYAIFHAMSALFALDGRGFKKHSGVLANFNKDYIKTGLLEVEYAQIAKEAFSLRTQSDYGEFYVVSKQEVKEQHENAERFVKRIEDFLEEQIK
ncbi:HEPN domain-containing protein [Anaerovorax odorimutans]|uniref:HEPN domain-containing protein n=1 Tax=Anaerovorax odorimutans TaxID=109327 RepID=A0ABT1RTV0_9FIRM|nr:HEPN domain-containing protein [Anaerovorax odorimutans]MCQ4638625.1 HEPN domain-containing protein [Anaerovorax odorimutans]